jgi:hypothetical protein
MGRTVHTRIKLGDDLWKTAKKAAIAKEITLQDFLKDAVKDWIEKSQKKQTLTSKELKKTLNDEEGTRTKKNNRGGAI